MPDRQRQSGLTLIGFLFVAAVVVACTMIGFRMAPAYIEFYSVQKALQGALDETKDFATPFEVRKSFQRFADTGYIESVRGSDIEIQKIGNEITAYVSWTRKLHMVGNVSLFLEFDAVARR